MRVIVSLQTYIRRKKRVQKIIEEYHTKVIKGSLRRKWEVR